MVLLAAVTLRCTTPRLEAALDLTAQRCGCGGLVFAPGWWCDDCNRCAHPLWLDCDCEANGDEEPEDYA